MGVTTAIAVAGTGYTIYQGEEAGKERRQAVREQQAATRAANRLREIATARERRKALAEARKLAAATRATAGATGTGGTSAVQGALSSVSAQTAERLGFSKVQQLTGQQIAGFESTAAAAGVRAQEAQARSQLPRQLGFEPSFASLFKGEEQPKK
jgi:hypothetical protein